MYTRPLIITLTILALVLTAYKIKSNFDQTNLITSQPSPSIFPYPSISPLPQISTPSANLNFDLTHLNTLASNSAVATPSSTIIPDTNSEIQTIASLIAKKQTQTCTTDDGTFYFTSKGSLRISPKVKSNPIVIGINQLLYVYVDGKTDGIKLSFTKGKSFLDQELDGTCQPWIVDPKLFTYPDNVKFTSP